MFLVCRLTLFLFVLFVFDRCTLEELNRKVEQGNLSTKEVVIIDPL